MALIPDEWLTPGESLGQFVIAERDSRLLSYQSSPKDVTEHANIEAATAQGAYGRRQLHELIQNGADAIMESARPGKIHVVLTDEALYCANEGEPLAEAGAEAILHSHMSEKRGTEIGRFGLGFKSVLAITDRPRFYSRTGSFYFDAQEARSVIGGVVGGLARYPILRLAFPVDPRADAGSDSVLRELMLWATTVVKLPRTAASEDLLSEDLADFPAQFMLFSRHVEHLILEDRTRSDTRSISLKHVGEEIVLQDRSDQTRWRVFEISHRPSESAKKDAGELAKRDEVPLVWAVPLEPRKDDGQFWAFFSTEYTTTLKGILNCPWKTNEDRTNLLQGDFNTELIIVAAELIANSAESVSTAEDPARFLDVMPARGDEARNWADAALTEQVYKRAQLRPCLPDQDGTLRLPSELSIHPEKIGRDQLSVDALLLWSSTPGRPSDWVHPTVGTRNARNRRPRVERLCGKASVATAEEWLEALVPCASAASSVAALKVADLALDPGRSGFYRDGTEADIVLLSDGQLAGPQETIYLLSEGAQPRDGVKFVAPELSNDPDTRVILERLGVHEVCGDSLLKDFLIDHAYGYSATDWQALWELVAVCDPAIATGLLKRARYGLWGETLHAMSGDGDWRPLAELLLPGPVIPEGSDDNRDLVVDTVFHARHMEVFRMLGATAVPTPGGGSKAEAWYREYLADCRSDFQSSQTSNPQLDRLDFDERSFAGPLEPLRALSPQAASAFTAAFLEAEHDLCPWTMRHSTQEKYAPREYENPQKQLLEQLGYLETSQGLVPLGECVSGELRRFPDGFPVPRLGDEYLAAFDLASSYGDLGDDAWAAAYDRILASGDATQVVRFYSMASQCAEVRPTSVRCLLKGDLVNRGVDEVTVTCSPLRAAALDRDGCPYLQVESAVDEQVLSQSWGMKSGEDAVAVDVEVVGATVLGVVGDEYPGMEQFLDDASGLTIVRAEELYITTLTDSGRDSRPVDFHVKDGRVYVLSALGPETVLARLSDELDLRMSAADIQAVLRSEDDQKLRELRARIVDAVSPAEKIATAIGVDRIIRRLPRGLVSELEDLEADRTGVRAAAAALSVFGIDALRQYRDEFVELGFRAPSQWAGSHAARRFCRELGFPTEFAGFEGEDRRPNWDVDGLRPLDKLHDYQATVVQRVRDLVSAAAGAPSRGMLSLPTGAGKTRVAVEAICRELASGGVQRVLWIAQSDELCEQSVQSWYHVWRAIGRDRLRISRLWSDNEVDEAPGGSGHVLVATVAKLEVIRKRATSATEDGDAPYLWLKNVDCVVVDEAHSAISPEYTRVLEWLGLGKHQNQDRCPLLGLTATPFKGVSEDETRRLVQRFGSNRLDDGLFQGDPYVCLQADLVLARVRHHLLEGALIELTSGELEQLTQTRRLPSRVGVALADNRPRNRSIVDCIAGHPDDWNVLVFAASVEHAQVLAALLDARGIPSRSVSGDTRPGVRRHYVSQFKAGEIRVLTNYGVLTEGFDAPATRAIYVARPTFSPNVYQQMIGRGLRGPANGGTDECLIVNVKDTVANFGEQLAFTKFDHLWSS